MEQTDGRTDEQTEGHHLRLVRPSLVAGAILSYVVLKVPRVCTRRRGRVDTERLQCGILSQRRHVRGSCPRLSLSSRLPGTTVSGARDVTRLWRHRPVRLTPVSTRQRVLRTHRCGRPSYC